MIIYKKGQIQYQTAKTRAGILPWNAAANTSKILQHQNAANTVQITDRAINMLQALRKQQWGKAQTNLFEP